MMLLQYSKASVKRNIDRVCEYRNDYKKGVQENDLPGHVVHTF